MRAIVFMVILSIVLLSTAALADVPGLMSYQGTLTDGAGVAIDTTVAMTFSIYNDSTGGAQVWTETQAAVDVTDGIFNVLLGSVNTIIDTVFNEPDRWLGIQVGGDAEMSPRQRIASVGYALTAGSAAGASDGDWTMSGDDIYSAVSGNVGIGDATPDAKLDVTGAINTDSVYSIGGATVLSVEGVQNTMVGEGAGATSTGDYNTYLGYQAGNKGQGMYNTFIGLNAGLENTNGYGNTFVGRIAGRDNTTGPGNTFLGSGAGTQNEDGSSNTFVGSGAGNANVSSSNNTFVGNGAGFNNTAGSNTFVGQDAGRANSSGTENTFLGRLAGWSNTIGNDNTILGTKAGYLNSEGYSNTFVGKEAGNFNTTGYRNVALGLQAGYHNSGGADNVFLGYKAGYNETGSEKLYIANGPDTSDVLIQGDFATGKVGIGLVDPSFALDVDGSINLDGALYFGGETMLSTPTHPTIESGNTFVGLNAGYVDDPSDPPDHGTMVGFAAGQNNDGGDNTFIGYQAGNTNTTGSSNTFIGQSAGFSNSAGSGNIFIGSQAGYNETGSNKLYIANSPTTDPLIYGDFDTSFVNIGGKLSVGSPSLNEPVYDFDVTGDMGVSGAVITDSLIVYDAVENGLEVNGNLETDSLLVTNWARLNNSALYHTIDLHNIPLVTLHVDLVKDLDDLNIGHPILASKYFKSNKVLKKDFHKILEVIPKSGLDKESGVEVAGIFADDLDAMGLTELVTYYDGEPGYPKYDLITVYMLEIMKEQVKEIEDLRAEVEALKRGASDLERRSRE